MATPTAVKRLTTDYKELLKNPIPFISVKVRATQCLALSELDLTLRLRPTLKFTIKYFNGIRILA